jgi:hypothetical protein
LSERRYRDELRSLTGCCGQSGDATFESCYAFFEDIDSGLIRVHVS